MASSSRPPNRISKRVLFRWEKLVGQAISAAEARALKQDEDAGGKGASATGAAVPQSLLQRTNIDAILEMAEEFQREYPQVALILCEYAYSLSQNLDPASTGTGVLQFKTGLLAVIKQKMLLKRSTDLIDERIDRRDYIYVIQEFYRDLRERQKLEGLENEDRVHGQNGLNDEDPIVSEQRTEAKRKMYITAEILNEVINVLKREFADVEVIRELKRVMEDDANKLRAFKPYNILPLESPGVANAFEYIPEVTAATRAIEYITNSSELPHFPDDYNFPEDRAVDILDFLQYAFGFQAANAANQREHLILLLSNSQARRFTDPAARQAVGLETKLQDEAVVTLHTAFMDNYERWRKYLGQESMAKSRTTSRLSSMQFSLFMIALYLLIWGEAANLRFLPECLCYIFHHMAHELQELLEMSRVKRSQIFLANSPHSFLDKIVTPIHKILCAEAKICAGGKAPHSSWRNYDDFNEFFWAPSCFEIGWPWRLEAGFFVKPKKVYRTKADKLEPKPRPEVSPLMPGERREKKVGKTNFVEHRTGFHLYHSFHRLWILLVCMLQGLAVFAFCDRKLTGANLKYILSVGPTFVIMKFIQSALDVTLMWGAYRSTRGRTILRTLIRFFWFAMLSAVMVILYIKTIQEEESGLGFQTWFNIYCLVLGMYGGLQFCLALLLRIPWFRTQGEKCSDFSLVQVLQWLHQEQTYVGRGMYERTADYLMYTLFWLVVGACKFSFSYFLQIQPMVGPTRIIIGLTNINYQWRDLISKSNHNALTLVSLWAPVIMIYFLDLQVWYTVASAIIGGLDGAVMHLGEIRSLDTLRMRFSSLPTAFVKRLHPSRGSGSYQMTRSDSLGGQAPESKVDAIKFAPFWNAIIRSFREEDLINNREEEWLLMPDNKIMAGTNSHYALVQWPLFLLANKVYVACDIVGNKPAAQVELWDKIGHDPYMKYAVQEAYDSLKIILLDLLNVEGSQWVTDIYNDINVQMGFGELSGTFHLNQVASVLKATTNLTQILAAEIKRTDEKGRAEEVETMKANATRALIDLYEVVMRDFVYEHSIRAKYENNPAFQAAKQEGRLFNELTWPTGHSKTQVDRLNYLLTIKDSAINVPRNLEARRRLEYFSNSLFMSMPNSRPVREMFSFSVFTPYFEEDVLYSQKQLIKENDDGITMLYYLRTIVPDEWDNFLERVLPSKIERHEFLKRTFPKEFKSRDYEKLKVFTEKDQKVLRELRLWASYRGQTLARTVRGMMYYKSALMLQAQQEGASLAEDLEQGIQLASTSTRGQTVLNARAQAELKFVYVVSAQIYGEQKTGARGGQEAKEKAEDISYLMQTNDSLRIAYIHTEKVLKDGKPETEYYSKLIKADLSGKDQEIYSIKLPGEVILGEGKPENQNHAIVFTRGEAIQTIDMNQEHYLEEAFKMRNLLEEFDSKKHGLRLPTILGVREHVFTGSVSSLAWFMSLQERSFVTLGQRVLAKPLKVRMHYGHPDVFHRTFHITRGGISKASKQINLSEDIFAGFNSTLRQGNITHHEYIQCGKGRDVGLNQIAAFEGKVASGNGEQTLSRDIYRLGQLFDFFRMCSFFFTTVGYYFTTMMTVLTVYAFLYGKVYLALSGVDAELKRNGLSDNTALQSALDTQFLLQIGIFTAVPMIVNFILEQGVLRAVISFFTMQLQLSSVFFTFSLGTRTHYFGRTILHGGAKYKSTGRGFVVEHISFAENYRLYSRSHFVKALEIVMLLIVYLAYGSHSRSSVSYILLTFSAWFLAISWLYAPYIFNPSGFDWKKTVNDFEDWTNWLFYKGGIGDKGKNSWEVWWVEEHEHIQTTRGRFWEIVLSLRFFIIQYGVVYALNVSGHDKNFRVYGYSWLVLVGVVLLFKVFSLNHKSFANFQMVVRLVQAAVFLGIIAGAVVALVLTKLTVGDIFASALSLIPTGWGLLSIAIAAKPVVKQLGLWKSIRGIARLYDTFMGTIVFIPIAFLSWFPFISTFQTRLVFNQAFSRGLSISVLLAGNDPNNLSS